MARFIELLLVLGCAAQVARAYPVFWSREPHPCNSHPEKAYGRHLAPQKDSTIKFALTSAANKVATSVCPGDTYKVTLNFPEPRLALLTASAGKFTQSSTECPNRQYFDRSEGFAPKAVQEISLVIPCGQVEPIVLKVTSARGPASAYYQSTSTLPIGAGCVATDACKAAAAKAATKPTGTPLAAASKPVTPAAAALAAAAPVAKPAPVIMAPKPGY